MPPKGKKSEPSKKTEQKQKQKIIEDKTFGLKNKKGTKQQKFVKTVTQQVQFGNKSAKQLEKEKAQQSLKKEEKKKTQEELNTLFKPVEQKIGKGADPKSVLCAFFKANQCTKGAKCKFSHDLTLERKAEKRSIYDAENKDETMEDWDEQKLEDVINKKHGEKNKALPKTSIICRYFLDALENGKYGWFWTCPNGDTCHYRHALPPGFVLKKDQKKMDEQKVEISLEELIEKERAALNSTSLTKVTLESFLKWKDRKRKEKLSKLHAETDKKKADYKAGRAAGISGRQMFEFNPDLVMGDDEEADDSTTQYPREDDEEEEEGPCIELTLDMLAASATADLDTETVANHTNGAQAANHDSQQESEKMEVAGALPPDADTETDAAIAAAMSATINGDDITNVPIDENLFGGEDLDAVDEELETLDLSD